MWCLRIVRSVNSGSQGNGFHLVIVNSGSDAYGGINKYLTRNNGNNGKKNKFRGLL